MNPHAHRNIIQNAVSHTSESTDKDSASRAESVVLRTHAKQIILYAYFTRPLHMRNELGTTYDNNTHPGNGLCARRTA